MTRKRAFYKIVGTGVIALFALRFWSHRQSKNGAASPLADKFKLEQVQILFRHGARTPLRTIPNVQEVTWDPAVLFDGKEALSVPLRVIGIDGGQQPYSPLDKHYHSKKLKGGASSGQLTFVGKQQMVQLGERLRSDYLSSLFDGNIAPSDLYVRSTNIERTVESAQAVLFGLFGNSGRNVKDSVPVHVAEAKDELLYPNLGSCPPLRSLVDYRWTVLGSIPNHDRDVKELYEFLGIDSTANFTFVEMRDELTAREAHGLPIPSDVARWIPISEKHAADIYEKLYTGGPQQSQIAVGPLLHLLRDNVRHSGDKTAAPHSPRMHLYSAHDSTLFVLLIALNIYDGIWPPFAADFRVESYRDATSNEKYVRVLYRGKVQKLPQCQTELCSLAEFEKAISEQTVDSAGRAALCSLPETAIRQHSSASAS